MTNYAGPGPVDTQQSVTGHHMSHERGGADALQAFYDEYDAAVTAAAAALVAATVGVVPIGGIIAWSGSVASIPTHWQLCDGTNGTPNLKDAFIYGAGGTKNPGDTGGSATQANHTDHNHSLATLLETSVGGAVPKDFGTSTGGLTGSPLSHGTNLPPFWALAYIQRMS